MDNMDTFFCARNSGDDKYLYWLKERLIYVYGESEHVDFVLTLDNFSNYFKRRRNVPRWLNLLLRKYDL